MIDTMRIVNGMVTWLQNGIRFADSVIEREATFSLDRAVVNIYSSNVGMRDLALAYLSIFPLLIKKAEDDGRGAGPSLEILCAGHDVHCDGHVLWLRSDVPITVCMQPGKEELISFVLAAPDRLIVRRGSIYLNIQMPSPNCVNCDRE